MYVKSVLAKIVLLVKDQMLWNVLNVYQDTFSRIILG